MAEPKTLLASRDLAEHPDIFHFLFNLYTLELVQGKVCLIPQRTEFLHNFLDFECHLICSGHVTLRQTTSPLLVLFPPGTKKYLLGPDEKQRAVTETFICDAHEDRWCNTP